MGRGFDYKQRDQEVGRTEKPSGDQEGWKKTILPTVIPQDYYLIDHDGIKKYSERAWLVDFYDRELWVPVSIATFGVTADLGVPAVIIPEWYCKKSGLIQ